MVFGFRFSVSLSKKTVQKNLCRVKAVVPEYNSNAYHWENFTEAGYAIFTVNRRLWRYTGDF